MSWSPSKPLSTSSTWKSNAKSWPSPAKSWSSPTKSSSSCASSWLSPAKLWSSPSECSPNKRKIHGECINIFILIQLNFRIIFRPTMSCIFYTNLQPFGCVLASKDPCLRKISVFMCLLGSSLTSAWPDFIPTLFPMKFILNRFWSVCCTFNLIVPSSKQN